MWQDGLALLIVAIAALALLRLYVPFRLFRFGARRKDDGSAATDLAPTGCSGCGSGASCAKAQVKVHPIAIRRHERFPSSGSH